MAWGDTCGMGALCCARDCPYTDVFIEVCGVTQQLGAVGTSITFDISDEFFIKGTFGMVAPLPMPITLTIRVLQITDEGGMFKWDLEYDIIHNGLLVQSEVQVSILVPCHYQQNVTLLAGIGPDFPADPQLWFGDVPIYWSNASFSGFPCCRCTNYTMTDFIQYENTDTSAADIVFDTKVVTAQNDVVYFEVTTKSSDKGYAIRMGYNHQWFYAAGVSPQFDSGPTQDGDWTYYDRWADDNHPDGFWFDLRLADNACPDPKLYGNIDTVDVLDIHFRDGNDKRGVTISCGT